MYFILLTNLFYIINAHAVRSDLTDEKIVGGNRVNVADYPYTVRLEDSSGLFCGGTIISNHHVLCAAHCMTYAREPLVVHAGSSFLSMSGTIHHIKANVSFGSGSTTDVAVLRVAEPFVFDTLRQPIQLAGVGEEAQVGEVAVALGFGKVGKHEIPANQLKAVALPIVSREECNKIYRHTPVGEIGLSRICAGFLFEGGQDACEGDTGGPLVSKGKQVGIISTGLGCARPYFPGVYANVAYFSDWIKKQIATL